MSHAPRRRFDLATPSSSTLLRVLPLALAVLATAPAPGAASEEIPLDENGLPMWEVRVFEDFPVRIELESREALAELLERVPIAGFSREVIRVTPGPDGEPEIVIEPRVTEEEATALREAGYAYELLPDGEKTVRREMEESWRRQTSIGGDAATRGQRGVYHNHSQIGAILAQAETDHPTIADTYSIGYSVQGRALHMIKISDNVDLEEAEPEVRLSGTIHGNEPPAQEMLLYLVEHLTDQYGIDPDVTYLVDNYEIFILPCHNPDGLTLGRRENASWIDLNRNFPVPSGVIGDDHTWTEEAETVLFKNDAEAHHYVVSANGHTGALVVNYPWDFTYTPSWDDAAIVELSLEYSTYNLPMYYGSWSRGIVRGALWYVVEGSLQDWSYADTGCIDVTLELCNTHTPPASQLDGLWDDNRDSYLHYIKAARYGVNGVVTDAASGQPVKAVVWVSGNSKPVHTDPDHGDYYKLLPTGTYDLRFQADGYEDVIVSDVSTSWGTPTVLDVQMGDPTGVDPVAGPAMRLAASPNPFVDGTTVRFSVGSPAETATGTKIAVYDLQGRRVRTLLEGTADAGTSVDWDGRSDTGEAVANGVYFIRLRVGQRHEVTKVMRAR